MKAGAEASAFSPSNEGNTMGEHYDRMIEKLKTIRGANAQPYAIRAAIALAYLEKMPDQSHTAILYAAKIMEGNLDT